MSRYLTPFYREHFFNHMEPEYVYRASEIKNVVATEVNERGFLEGFENAFDEAVERQNKIMRSNSIGMRFCEVPLPAKVSDRGSYDYIHEYLSIDSEYYGGLQIYVRFTKDDSQETKDTVIEFVLSRFHQLYNCHWTRETSDDHTRFETKVYPGGPSETRVQIYVSDNLGCYIETIKEDRTLSDWELKNLQAQADGTIIRVLDDYKVGKDGKIVKVETRTKAHCSGTPE